jgi:hypothetical protein
MNLLRKTSTMSRTNRSCRRDSFTLPSLALAGLLIVAFTLSMLTSRRIEAQSDGTPQAPNREVSHKLWVSAQEIKDRFPAAKHEEFIYEEFTLPASAGTISETQVLQDEAVKVWKEYAGLSNNVPY